MFLYQTAKYIACFGDEQGIFSIFCSCFVHKHKSILVCLSFQRTSGLLCFHVLWRIIVNTCTITLSCFVQSNFVSEHLQHFATKHVSMHCSWARIHYSTEHDHIMGPNKLTESCWCKIKIGNNPFLMYIPYQGSLQALTHTLHLSRWLRLCEMHPALISMCVTNAHD